MRIMYLFVFIFSFTQVKANYEFTPVLQQSYQCLFKLRIDSARHYLKQSEKINTDNRINLLLANYIDLLELMLTEDPVLYQNWKTNIDIRIEKIKDDDERSPYKGYVLGELYFQSTLLKLRFGDNVSGILDFRKAYGYLHDNEIKYPTFSYHQKTLGIIRVMLSLIPDNFKWVVELLGYDIDYSKGIKQLKTALSEGIVTRNEAFLMNQWLQVSVFGKNKSSLDEMSGYVSQNTSDKLAGLIWILILKKNNRAAEGLEKITEYVQDCSFFVSPYVYFLHAQLLLLKGDYENCHSQTFHFLAIYKGGSLKKAAYYQLYLTDYISNKTSNLNRYRDSVFNQKKTLSELDKIADKRLKEEQYPDINLLKARLFFDGGYYDEAILSLDKTNPKTLKKQKEQVEYYYRKARIYEKKSDKAQAVRFYGLAIETQKKEPYYFAPNAYLQMAKLLQNEDKRMAMIYLISISTYDGYDYQNEIEAEAKALKKMLK